MSWLPLPADKFTHLIPKIVCTSLVQEVELLESLPWTSLVAEFGGTLSLFLGFSFMTLWEGVEVVARTVGRIKEDW